MKLSSAMGGFFFQGDVLVDFLVESRPVGHAPIHGSYMNEVEALFGECPLAADIVNFESTVWRNKVRLNWR